MDRFIEHARHIGAEIIEEKIVSLKEKAGYFELGTPNSQYNADTVILATGISRSSLLPGEKEFLGRGEAIAPKSTAPNTKVSALLRSPLFLMRWKK